MTHCVIEVIFRPAAKTEWLDVPKDFLAKTDGTNFSELAPGQDGVAVSFLVNEALRLYPPTRRIYRQFDLSSKEEPEQIAAEIEACHRLPTIWGDESNKYQPARWSLVEPSMRKAFMPFGGPPFTCPASSSLVPG